MTVNLSSYWEMRERTNARKSVIKIRVSPEYSIIVPRYENSFLWRIRDYFSLHNNSVFIYKNKKLVCCRLRFSGPFFMSHKIFITIPTQELKDLSGFIEEEYGLNIEVV